MKNRPLLIGLAAVGAIAAGMFGTSFAPVLAAGAVPVPVAAVDLPPAKGLQTAVLAGGCFWGLEGVFEHVRGVREVTAGYAGGDAKTANYDAVSSETTGHAEAVRIVYDPAQVSYATLLRIYFSVAHDPTQLNRQGPDRGTSYRSAIFAANPDQAKVARAYIAQLTRSGTFKAPIVTRIESARFFPAEAWHQNYLDRNPDSAYIRINDLPKLAAFKAAYPALYRPKSAA
jgi:peptide-methionine (S)-S-oxide reductase